ncbi:MAG: hypothetical protein IPG33_14635 [Betaproteobacteria bacterium]|nr:hypothetical protein [Betaproteobacteria bacterium]
MLLLVIITPPYALLVMLCFPLPHRLRRQSVVPWVTMATWLISICCASTIARARARTFPTALCHPRQASVGVGNHHVADDLSVDAVCLDERGWKRASFFSAGRWRRPP